MKKTKYVGLFKSAEGNTYELKTDAFSFFEAFFLLTADAIRSGRHYQLHYISDGRNKVFIDDILKISSIFF